MNINNPVIIFLKVKYWEIIQIISNGLWWKSQAFIYKKLNSHILMGQIGKLKILKKVVVDNILKKVFPGLLNC